jgi:hypothetical protein
MWHAPKKERGARFMVEDDYLLVLIGVEEVETGGNTRDCRVV